MSAQELTRSLMSELLAIRRGQCIWCRRGEAHPEYSQCPHKHTVRSVNGDTSDSGDSHPHILAPFGVMSRN
jgi:hypothetical protein